ncbi:MAG TPA: hypothetical protein VFS00_14125 [Polyangiaceae bacterium]|nr:hypothetical protein [Polyangiaceae bacterium]
MSFRLDPCFRAEGAGDCVPQVRLLWQPQAVGDAAVHTLYRLISRCGLAAARPGERAGSRRPR